MNVCRDMPRRHSIRFSEPNNSNFRSFRVRWSGGFELFIFFGQGGMFSSGDSFAMALHRGVLREFTTRETVAGLQCRLHRAEEQLAEAKLAEQRVQALSDELRRAQEDRANLVRELSDTRILLRMYTAALGPEEEGCRGENSPHEETPPPEHTTPDTQNPRNDEPSWVFDWNSHTKLLVGTVLAAGAAVMFYLATPTKNHPNPYCKQHCRCR